MTTLAAIRQSSGAQIVLGLFTGILFGFLLQKGGATDYRVIEGQLLLTDFTVLKLMLSAVIVGMVLFHLLKQFGYTQTSMQQQGSVGSNVIGGLIFGAGFALLGYCPGTVAGAVGTGALDALFGGMVGMLLGAGFFAASLPGSEAAFLIRDISRGNRPGIPAPEPMDYHHPDGSAHDRIPRVPRIYGPLTITFFSGTGDTCPS